MNRFIFAAAILLSTACAAMAYDFKSPILTIDGKPFTGADGKVIETTLGSICTNALLSDYQDEKLTGEQKYKRYELAKAINDHHDWHLSVEELALIKTMVAKAYNPLITGQVFDMLDPKPAPEKK